MDKTLPHDFDEEKETLGSMIIDKDKVDDVASILEIGDFYFEKHNEIYKVILKLHDDLESEVDLVAVTSKLRDKELLDELGGAKYLSSLCDIVATPESASFHANKVKKYSTLRRIVKTGNNLVKLGYSKESNVEEVLNEVEEKIYQVAENTDKNEDIIKLKNSKNLYKHIDDIEERVAQENITGISTGIKALDNKTAGLHKPYYTILAARPSMGKTMVSLNVAKNIVENKDRAGLIFSAEMSKKEILDRLLASEAGVDSLKILKGQLKDEDRLKITDAAGKLNNMNLTIYGKKHKRIQDIRAKARKVAREENIDFIVVDYLQLLDGFDNESREQQVSKLSRALNSLGEELNVHMMVLSQLNRQVENRQNKRPILADLKFSGSIEQDADNVIFVYRDEYYNPQTEKKNIMELILAKCRNGKVGTVNVAYDLAYQTIYDLDGYKI